MMSKEQVQLQDVLAQCTVEHPVGGWGWRIQPPDRQQYPIERDLYLALKKRLEDLGGKWKGGNCAAFIFPNDPTALFQRVSVDTDFSLKKEFNFFETPKVLARRMVSETRLQPGETILEPSAGRAALLDAFGFGPEERRARCQAIELLQEHAIEIRKKGYPVISGDFLTVALPLPQYDVVIANPPFSKNQDIRHFRKMYAVARRVVVCILGTHWVRGQERECKEFREWLDTLTTTQIPLPAGTFTASGTDVAAVLIVATKTAADTYAVATGDGKQVVPALAVCGRFFVHQDLTDPKRLALTHKASGCRVLVAKKDTAALRALLGECAAALNQYAMFGHDTNEAIFAAGQASGEWSLAGNYVKGCVETHPALSYN